jgi:hypothetical protein
LKNKKGIKMKKLKVAVVGTGWVFRRAYVCLYSKSEL